MTTLAVFGLALLIVVMVVLYVAGATQMASVLGIVLVFPVLIFIGSKRKMARKR